MVTPTVSIFLWLLPSNFAGHFQCIPDIWNQLIFHLFKIKKKGLLNFEFVNDFWETVLWILFLSFFLFSFWFFLPFSLYLSFLSLCFFCVWQNKRPRKGRTYGATCFKLLTPKQVCYCFLWGEHNVIKFSGSLWVYWTVPWTKGKCSGGSLLS